MDASLFVRLKDFIQQDLGLPSETILVWLGLACFLAACLVMRRAFTWPWALVPGLCLAIGLETLDILDHYSLQGFLGSPSREMAEILLRHSKDVAITNLAPLMIWLTAMVLTKLRGA